ncbi:MAG: A/G-specific adenine glycosylase [Micavibrio sp.]|nr:A/G-specific adenine glycosylase [Micavibrio sp.]
MTAAVKNNKSSDDNFHNFRKKILRWYDKHQRTLPWRATKEQKSNPYHVWLSEVMLQQTTVITVGPYFERFITKWPTIHDLAHAPQDDVMHEWAGLGYYARARNLHKCAQIVSNEYNGKFPDTQEELIKLPGIGDYSSNSIAAIAFNKPANVVDGNVERVMVRYYAVQGALPDNKKQLKELAGVIAWGEIKRSGDYAQALMDLGATICTPKNPKCSLCPLKSDCQAKEQGIAADLPKKKPKKAKPQKYGYVYWVSDAEDNILLERRGEKEMLGGMLGLPTSEWILGAKPEKHPNHVKHTKPLDLVIKHSFTHFDLHLNIITAQSRANIQGNKMVWLNRKKLSQAGLPTLFKKVVKLMK